MPPPPDSGVHDVTLAALMDQPLLEDGGLNVTDSLSELVSKIRENITVRRATRVSAFNGVIGAYVHGSVSSDYPMMGSSAAVVSITSEQPLTDEAKSTLEVAANPHTQSITYMCPSKSSLTRSVRSLMIALSHSPVAWPCTWWLPSHPSSTAAASLRKHSLMRGGYSPSRLPPCM